jgi:hypothetical protein
MARMNYEKAAQRIRASQDIREALEEGAIEDVYVVIDKEISRTSRKYDHRLFVQIWGDWALVMTPAQF